MIKHEKLIVSQPAKDQIVLDLNNPPPWWPDWLSFPPGSPGPAFPLAAPVQTTEETGIRWYNVEIETRTQTGRIIGINTKKQEISSLSFTICDSNQLKWVISDNSIRLSGHIVAKLQEDDKVLIQGVLGDNEYSGVLAQEVEDIQDFQGDICLKRGQLRLLHQWSRIAEPLVRTGELIACQAGDTDTARGSCFGCSMALVGLGLGSVSCVASLGLSCAAVAFGYVGFFSNCEGACA